MGPRGNFLVSAFERRLQKAKNKQVFLSYLKLLNSNNVTLYNHVNFLKWYKVQQLSLLAYVIMHRLFSGKFSNLTQLNKFIGQSPMQRQRRRKRWTKSMKNKVPYYYLNSSRGNPISQTYTKLKFYKLFWKNNEIFKATTLSFIKRYSVFGKRAKMLKNILKRILKKSKKKKLLNKYKYSSFLKNYSFKKNININSVSGMFNGIQNELTQARSKWKRQKNQNIRKIKFRKFFFKTLIEGRSLVKLVLRKQFKRKSGLSDLISASAHTTFFTRLHQLEFSLFNIILRSRFTTSIKDAFLWVKSGYVFINNTPVTNPYASLDLGDRVQLAMTNRYFIYKKTYFSKHKQDVAKLRAKLWLKNRGKFNLFRKRSKNWPKWILRTTYYKAIVPNFLEVDYLTLTSVIVCLPKTILEYDSVLWRYLNVYNFRLYNWKITN